MAWKSVVRMDGALDAIFFTSAEGNVFFSRLSRGAKVRSTLHVSTEGALEMATSSWVLVLDPNKRRSCLSRGAEGGGRG